jgi:hypothetical protein
MMKAFLRKRSWLLSISQKLLRTAESSEKLSVSEKSLGNSVSLMENPNRIQISSFSFLRSYSIIFRFEVARYIWNSHIQFMRNYVVKTLEL